jgi:hypothetical protein
MTKIEPPETATRPARADEEAAPIYLTEAEFSERYRVPARTAQRWRSTGDGPAFVRAGPRRVLYRVADCEAWAASRTFRHRSAELAAKQAGE